MIVEVTNKLKTYEEADGKLVIYDTAIVCGRENGVIYKTDMDVIWENSNSVFHLNADMTKESALEKYADKLHEYKHTFRKVNDGKYYWFSSEIVK